MTFGPIRYTKPGDYSYRIRQITDGAEPVHLRHSGIPGDCPGDQWGKRGTSGADLGGEGRQCGKDHGYYFSESVPCAGTAAGTAEKSSSFGKSGETADSKDRRRKPSGSLGRSGSFGPGRDSSLWKPDRSETGEKQKSGIKNLNQIKNGSGRERPRSIFVIVKKCLFARARKRSICFDIKIWIRWRASEHWR